MSVRENEKHQVARNDIKDVFVTNIFVDSTRNHTLTVKTHGKSNDSSK